MSAFSSPLPAPDLGSFVRSPACVRPPVAEARRIVVKLGTRVLSEDDGSVAVGRLSNLLATVAALRQNGREVLIVMSGSVSLGRTVLGVPKVPRDGAMRQACAAVGQARMTDLYRRIFHGLGVLSAQVLVAQGDFEDHLRRHRLVQALEALLDRGVVPVLNENDAVAREGLGPSRQVAFDDNDRLAAVVAASTKADLLALLTDVEGVFDRDPRHDPSARPLARVDAASPPVEAGGPGTASGRGGMRSKLAAAEIARRAGCHVVIASGCSAGTFSHLVAGESRGTWFLPHASSVAVRQGGCA